MSKGFSDSAVQAVDRLAKQGMEPKDILASLPTLLAGKKMGSVYSLLRRLGYGKKTEPLVKVSPEKRLEIRAYLLAEGKDLPAHVVAERFVVKPWVVFQERASALGKPEKRIRRAVPEDRSRADVKGSKTVARQRINLYHKLCVLRLGLLAQEPRPAQRVCTVCQEPWFATSDFYQTNNRSGRAFWGACRLCMGEMRVLQRMGKKGNALAEVLYNTVEQELPQKLTANMERDTELRCGDRLVACRRCEQTWFWNRRYFHSFEGGGRVVLLDLCLACPTRRFFCKPAPKNPKTN